MSTAAPVPETVLMSGDELSADKTLATLRRVGPWRLLKDAFTRFRYADGFSHGRALALQICLSFIPLAIALVGLATALGQHALGTVVSQIVLRLTPGHEDVVDAVVKQTQSRSDEAGHLALWLGLAAALVSLTTAMGQVERGANRIYGIERDRPTVSKYGRAFLLMLAAGLPALVGFLVLLAGGPLGDSLARTYHWGSTTHTAYDVLRWPVGVLLDLASITILFRRAPRRHQPAHSWLAVGAALALVLWLVFTLLLVLYVGNSGSVGSTYGPLTGIIAILVWANLTSIALLLGLAVAAQLEAARAGITSGAPPDPEPPDG